MYPLARNIFFRFSPETAHELAMDWLSAGQRLGLLKCLCKSVPSVPTEVMGLTFDNPVGLAAGMDKDGECIDAFGTLGFGCVEVGTVTPKPQLGNPKPRLFRIVEREALINRMGFNNKGVDHLVENLKKARYQGVIGVNIGKNKVTPMKEAESDYLTCLRKVYAYSGYVAVNLSSPNTPGLRQMQFGDALKSLLGALKEAQSQLAKTHEKYVPLAIKLAPDMTDDELRDIAAQLVAYEIDGVIATNTTLMRDVVQGYKSANEEGGLSGAPLANLSTKKIKVLAEALDHKLPIIGVGGVVDAQSAEDKIKAGASLVQIYSGFVYRGPRLIREASAAVAACR